MNTTHTTPTETSDRPGKPAMLEALRRRSAAQADAARRGKRWADAARALRLEVLYTHLLLDLRQRQLDLLEAAGYVEPGLDEQWDVVEAAEFSGFKPENSPATARA